MSYFPPFHTTYIILLQWFRLSLKNSLKGRIKSSQRRDRRNQKRGHSTHLFKGSRQTHHHTMQVLKRQWHRKHSSTWRDHCIWFNRCLFKKSLNALIFSCLPGPLGSVTSKSMSCLVSVASVAMAAAHLGCGERRREWARGCCYQRGESGSLL